MLATLSCYCNSCQTLYATPRLTHIQNSILQVQVNKFFFPTETKQRAILAFSSCPVAGAITDEEKYWIWFRARTFFFISWCLHRSRLAFRASCFPTAQTLHGQTAMKLLATGDRALPRKTNCLCNLALATTKLNCRRSHIGPWQSATADGHENGGPLFRAELTCLSRGYHQPLLCHRLFSCTEESTQAAM